MFTAFGFLPVRIDPNGEFKSVGCFGCVKAFAILLLGSLNSIFAFLMLTSMTNYVFDPDFVRQRLGLQMVEITSYTVPTFVGILASAVLYVLILK